MEITSFNEFSSKLSNKDDFKINYDNKEKRT